MFMANAAVSPQSWTALSGLVTIMLRWQKLTITQIGALVAHCIFFWGGDVVKAFKSAKAGRHDDRHHAHMVENYKEVPWWWYSIVLVFSFVLGLIVVTTQNVTLPAWAFIVSLLLGTFIAPFVRPLGCLWSGMGQIY